MMKIAKIFNETFSHWEIVLPQDALESRQRGMIQESGWTIHYLFAENDKGEYLDYYASHRMTNDRHMRIYAIGLVEPLETIQDFIIFPAGCSQEEQDQIEKQYTEKNHRIYVELKKKGFV